MAETADPLQQIQPQHQEIVQSTWSQLLNAEGGQQNLAVDLLKNLVKSAAGGQDGGGNRELLGQLSGLAGQFLGGGQSHQGDTSEPGPTDGGEPAHEKSSRGGGGFMSQLGGLAGKFLSGGKSKQNETSNGNGEPSNSGEGNFMDQMGGLGNLAGMASRVLGGQGGEGGGGGNLMQLLGGLAGINLKDPSSLLAFFLKSPIAQDAANPDNSSRDIYKMIKNAIFGLLGSKLPTEDFQENPDAKVAWKSYLGVIANALRKFAG